MKSVLTDLNDEYYLLRSVAGWLLSGINTDYFIICLNLLTIYPLFLSLHVMEMLIMATT